MADREYWVIRVEDGLEEKFVDIVPYGHLQEKSVIKLLSMLVAKFGLSSEEIVSACVSRKSKRRTQRFQLSREQGAERLEGKARYMLQVGDYPTVTATIWKHSDLDADLLALLNARKAGRAPPSTLTPETTP